MIILEKNIKEAYETSRSDYDKMLKMFLNLEKVNKNKIERGDEPNYLWDRYGNAYKPPRMKMSHSWKINDDFVAKYNYGKQAVEIYNVVGRNNFRRINQMTTYAPAEEFVRDPMYWIGKAVTGKSSHRRGWEKDAEIWKKWNK